MALWLAQQHILTIVGFVVLLILIFCVVFIAQRYRRCPSDRILVIYGKIGGQMASRCIHGGGAFVWPLIQDYAYLSLTPMTINIPLQGALSFQNIRINVPSTFTVGISVEPQIMTNAAERLLNLRGSEIESMVKEIIFGQLRLTVASLTIEQINQDRESFLDSIRKNVEPELNKVGLYLINVNITDITDESDYIAALGKKAASEAINRARIDVAEQEKLGAIGQSEANREKEIRVAENVAQSEKGQKKAEADRRIFVQQREADAIEGENESRARMAHVNADLAIKEALAQQQGQVAQREAQVQIQRAQYKAEQERLNAEEVVKEEIEKRKIEIAAEAEAEKRRREARGEADAILARYEAEAKGIRQVLDAKAEGYAQLVASCGADARAAGTLLMIEKIENIVSRQVEAIKNLKIDKITVWDGGQGGAGQGASSTSNFVSSLIKTLPPLHEVAGMAGVELPSFLGSTDEGASAARNATHPAPAPQPRDGAKGEDRPSKKA